MAVCETTRSRRSLHGRGCAAVLAALGLGLALPAAAAAADVEVELDTGDGFSVQNSGATIERFRVDEATGNISRNGSVFIHTDGGTFVGENAGNVGTVTSRSTAVGTEALSVAEAGANRNSAFGDKAMRDTTTGDSNSAFGYTALRDNTTGSENVAMGEDALLLNDTGSQNTAVGRSAMLLNVLGSGNTAVGYLALQDATGSNSTAVGSAALANATSGVNTAVGFNAMVAATSGTANTAVGREALELLTFGNSNVAVGQQALESLTTGTQNVAVGEGAGQTLTTGSGNIYVGDVLPGSSGENNTIRIGSASQSATYIRGIWNNVVGGTSQTVIVNASGDIGGVVSSARFKDKVQDMGESSSVLMKLRPVSFEYREEYTGVAPVTDYGLIAEEVARVSDELVILDEQGAPYTVRYHLLTPMLLNEVQKQQRTIEALTARLTELEKADSSGGAE